ncbi:MAG: recombinational DNA repair protein (RecF pathway) [Planctomycetota bacterium]|jgi:recombinational DNA repair protein (RecF pathway)
MSYQKYKTSAIVVGARNHGEGSRLIYILTKDLGLLIIRAQSIRELRSKIRFHVQYGDRCRVDLVRGKEFWRLTGGHKEMNTRHSTRSLYWFSRSTELIRSLAGFGEYQYRLFVILSEAVHSFHIHVDAPEELIDKIGHILLARILDEMGYWGDWHREIIETDIEELIVGGFSMPSRFSQYLAQAMEQAGV